MVHSDAFRGMWSTTFRGAIVYRNTVKLRYFKTTICSKQKWS